MGNIETMLAGLTATITLFVHYLLTKQNRLVAVKTNFKSLVVKLFNRC